jgi:hypothetical protein
VDRDLVLGEGIDTLHDIDLSTIWPVVTVHPPSGPSTASGRCVNSVHDDHTTGVSKFVSKGIVKQSGRGKTSTAIDNTPLKGGQSSSPSSLPFLIITKDGKTYRFFPWIRTALRPPETCSVWSTVITELPLLLIETKPLFQASLADR